MFTGRDNLWRKQKKERFNPFGFKFGLNLNHFELVIEVLCNLELLVRPAVINDVNKRKIPTKMLAVQGQADCQPSVSAQTSLRAHGYFPPASAF